jgi:hypothetical protein
MLLSVGAVVILIALAIIARIRATGGVNTLGWMSEHWLAEYRASNSP